MRWTRHAFAAALLAALAGANVAPTLAEEQRIALVIGNSAYPNSPLANPANDARLISAALRARGFEVIERLDVGRRDMARAVKDFGNRLKAGGGDTVGLFYYAGHGIQVSNQNYLIPIDAEIEDEGDVPIDAVSADHVLATIEDARNRLNIIFLDACRNNPFARGFRAAERGLAMMTAPTGIFIGYATAPGQIAADGLGANSPFTKSLAAAIRGPGVTIESLFKTVRIDVLGATQGNQTPWSASSLVGEFYFTPPAGIAVAEPVAPGFDDRAIELSFWQAIEGSDNPALFEGYLAKYPNGEFAIIATARLEELGGETELAMLTPPPAPSTSPGDSFRECPQCPEMVVVPSGSFRMGSSHAVIDHLVSDQEGKYEWYTNEVPHHQVSIGKVFAVGKYEVTRGEYAAFARATERGSGDGCTVYTGEDWRKEASRDWRDPGFSQGDTEPVVCVTWEDAKAYVSWLGRETGEDYRLLSEVEWEYAARAGTQTLRYWGDDTGAQCLYANAADRATSRQYADWTSAECDDGVTHTAAVGRYAANGFGLYDMLGNVWEWTEDCYHDTYSAAPGDGSAWTSGECGLRVLRGGSWGNGPRFVRAAYRARNDTGDRDNGIGFRVARTLY